MEKPMKKDLMKYTSLAYLMAFSKAKAPATAQMLRDKDPSLPPGNMVMQPLSKAGYLKQQGTGTGRSSDKRPVPLYVITPAGLKEKERQLQLAPLKDHPKGAAKATKPKDGPKRKYKKRKPAVQAPPPPPNLSVSAESLMGNVSVVLEENARLRDFLSGIHKQLGEMLYGSTSGEDRISQQDS